MKPTHAGLVIATGLALAAPLAAQTGTATSPNGAPPTTTDTKPATNVTPEQVIGVIKGLIRPEPSLTLPPAPPPPPPPPAPASTPAATATTALQPAPTAVSTLPPRPDSTTAPPQAPPTIAPPEAIQPMPQSVDFADPAPTGPDQPIAADVPGPLEPNDHLPIWPWFAAGLAALGLAETARRWFWPKVAISCEIAIGPSAMTSTSRPVFSPPDLAFDIRIEPGQASAPAGHSILAQGGTP